jgi:hypothetical protein
MARQPESRLVKRIRERLVKEHGGFWFKVWGGAFQVSGIPDLIGCCHGLFIAFEVKTDTGRVRPLQEWTIDEIRKWGGLAEVVRSPEEAIEYLEQHLAQFRFKPKASRTVRN